MAGRRRALLPSYGRVVWPRGLATDGLIGSAVPAADWLGVICKLAFPATPFCIRFAAMAASPARPKSRQKGQALQGRNAMKRRTVLAGLGATAAAGALGMPSILRAQAPVTLNGAVQFNDDHAFNRALIRFE